MARKIVKQIGGGRLGSGGKMMVEAHGYGFSTHDVGKVRRTSMSFGTIVPAYCWLMTSGSRLRINIDALITSNALSYQLYGTAKFQVDVFSARMALYNPKMLINLVDQGYKIEDIKFPLGRLTTKGYDDAQPKSTRQINPSSLMRYVGMAANGQNEALRTNEVTRDHNAMWELMYYHLGKEYYANKQEKVGVMIHNERSGTGIIVDRFEYIYLPSGNTQTVPTGAPIETGSTWVAPLTQGNKMVIYWKGETVDDQLKDGEVQIWGPNDATVLTTIVGTSVKTVENGWNRWEWTVGPIGPGSYWYGYNVNRIAAGSKAMPKLKEFDLKAIDRMQMKIMANVESTNPIIIDGNTEFPYGASYKKYGSGATEFKSINGTQEGLLLACYQSDALNNWLDNETINALTNKNKVKVDGNGEFSIDMLNITQKMYNYSQRVGITDGTLEEWRELTYGQASKGKSLKPVYEGGLSKEVVFDQVVSTASTADEPLGSIASRGQFGKKHKGGYVNIDTDEEKLVMAVMMIKPRIVYNQGNDWTMNLKTLDDLHKPALDKIGYQNLLTDQMHAVETVVKADRSLITYSAGKVPAWMWYRTNLDDALGNMADTEDYKVFGRSYEEQVIDGKYKIKDLTTYIDPTKFNDVFALASLDAMNFDVQIGFDAQFTLIMSEEVIPGL